MYKLIILAAIVFASKVDAQIGETPDSEAFAEVHPDTSFFYAKDGRISRVYGKAFTQGSSPSDTAQTFINEWAGIWNCDANDLIPVGPWGAGHHMQPMMYDAETGEYKFALDSFIKGQRLLIGSQETTKKRRASHQALSYGLCIAYRNIGNGELSERACHMSSQQNYEFPEAHYETAQTLMALGKMTEARRKLKLAAEKSVLLKHL